jgi:hypothetical protein
MCRLPFILHKQIFEFRDLHTFTIKSDRLTFHSGIITLLVGRLSPLRIITLLVGRLSPLGIT